MSSVVSVNAPTLDSFEQYWKQFTPKEWKYSQLEDCASFPTGRRAFNLASMGRCCQKAKAMPCHVHRGQRWQPWGRRSVLTNLGSPKWSAAGVSRRHSNACILASCHLEGDHCCPYVLLDLAMWSWATPSSVRSFAGGSKTQFGVQQTVSSDTTFTWSPNPKSCHRLGNQKRQLQADWKVLISNWQYFLPVCEMWIPIVFCYQTRINMHGRVHVLLCS